MCQCGSYNTHTCSLTKMISSLANGVCQGHTPSLFLSCADIELFQSWSESLDLLSSCFSNSFHEMWIWCKETPAPLRDKGSLEHAGWLQREAAQGEISMVKREPLGKPGWAERKGSRTVNYNPAPWDTQSITVGSGYEFQGCVCSK